LVLVFPAWISAHLPPLASFAFDGRLHHEGDFPSDLPPDRIASDDPPYPAVWLLLKRSSSAKDRG
jgi:hypothetical protein